MLGLCLAVDVPLIGALEALLESGQLHRNPFGSADRRIALFARLQHRTGKAESVGHLSGCIADLIRSERECQCDRVGGRRRGLRHGIFQRQLRAVLHRRDGLRLDRLSVDRPDCRHTGDRCGQTCDGRLDLHRLADINLCISLQADGCRNHLRNFRNLCSRHLCSRNLCSRYSRTCLTFQRKRRYGCECHAQHQSKRCESLLHEITHLLSRCLFQFCSVLL